MEECEAGHHSIRQGESTIIDVVGKAGKEFKDFAKQTRH